MSLGVKKAEAVSDLICILVFDDMKLKLITGILQCCDAYFADLAYVSVKYMPRQQKMTIRVNVRVNKILIEYPHSSEITVTVKRIILYFLGLLNFKTHS